MSHRLLGRDLLAALAWFVLATSVFTYPLVTAPASAHRLDSPDALLNAWIVSWNLHQLGRAPAELFDANIFFPERGALAYSENLLTGSLLAAPAAAVSANPILRVNVALFAGFVLTGMCTAWLAFDVTRDRLASLLAGTLFAFAPFRFAHIPHLQLQLAFGIPLCLLFARRLARGTPSPRLDAAGLAASALATFGSSVYYTVFVASALPVVAVAELLRLERPRRAEACVRLGAAGALAVIVTLPIAWPYIDKLGEGAVRSLAAAEEFSASPRDYLSSFSWLHVLQPKSSEPLFPGWVALGLAASALALGGARAGIRRFSWAVVGALGLAVSLGPPLGVFTLLYDALPFYRAIRVPSRAGVLVLLAVAVLAAIGLTRIRRRALRALLVALAAAECLAAPLPLQMDPPSHPDIYASVAALDGPGALIELPMPPRERFQDNAIYVYRSIFHWRPLVNGYSGFAPASYRARQRGLRHDFSAELSRAKRDGVQWVLAHEGRLGPRMRRYLRQALEDGRLELIAEASGDRLYAIPTGTE